MSDYKILIPSYRRASSQSTLSTLSACFAKEDIIIATQTTSDYDEYRKRYDAMATIIYREADSVGGNRNTLLEYCETHGVKHALLLDDDILGLLLSNGRKLKDAKEIKAVFDYFFQLATKCDATAFGTYPLSNTFFMKNRVSVNKIFIGTIFGILDTHLRFDETYRVKEDYELCLRLLSKGKRLLRFDNVSPIAKHKTAGGCADEWKSQQYRQYAERLVFTYPDIVKMNPKRAGEILMK